MFLFYHGTMGVIHMTSTYFDEWLDEYNDYMRLYDFFGDRHYLEEAIEILCSLKSIAIRNENHKMILFKIKNNNIHAF
jgi:hypothetical protein